MSNNPLFKFEMPYQRAKGEQRLSTGTYAANATRAGLWAEFSSKVDKKYDPVIPVSPAANQTQPNTQLALTAEIPPAPREAVKVVRLLDEKDQAEIDQQAYIAELTAAAKEIHNEPAA